MLPIDQLSEEALSLCRAQGLAPESFYAVLLLDKASDGGVGSCCLALDSDRGLLHRIEGTVESFPLADYSAPSIDSLLSANRLLVKVGTGEETYTVCLGSGTNACRERLFLFVSALEALLAGRPLKGDEPLFAKPPEKPQGEGRISLLRRAFSYFKPHRSAVFVIFICLLFEMAVDLIRPYLSGQLFFDEILSESGAHHNLTALFLCLGSIVFMGFFRYFVIIVRRMISTRMSLRVTHKMKGRLFDALSRQSVSYYNRQSPGRIAYHITGDVMRMQQFFSDTTMSLIIYLVEFLAVAFLLFFLNWKLSLLILVPVPLILLIYRRAFPKMQRMNNLTFRENRTVSNHISSSLDGIRVVKAFAKEEEESRLLARRLDRLYRVSLRANLLSAVVPTLVTLLIYLARETVFGIGGGLVMNGGISYGELTTYLGYIGMVFAPLQFFSTYANRVGTASESARRMMALLDAVPEIREAEDPIDLPTLSGDIGFRDVSFHYTQNRPILKHLSFDIHAGEHIGLVGRTGCGKTTLANLISRMYDTVSGEILLDGVDVRRLSFRTLRKNVALVSQEIYLFRGSVTENIRFACPDATEEEVIEAAKVAGAHDFIMALPLGYETEIGNGRRHLSGGERQRISIARAILSDPRILILDEATAAMDTETERSISEALGRLIKGKTTLSIAHRLSTLRECDRIMAMEDGELCEMGTREELLAQKGIFYKLYTLQNEQMQKVLSGEEETL